MYSQLVSVLLVAVVGRSLAAEEAFKPQEERVAGFILLPQTVDDSPFTVDELKNVQGSTTGRYYVLKEGGLGLVKHAAARLEDAQDARRGPPSFHYVAVGRQEVAALTGLRPESQPSAQLKSSPRGSEGAGSALQETRVRPEVLDRPDNREVEELEPERPLLATVYYTDVAPLAGPVYFQQPTLVRLLRSTN